MNVLFGAKPNASQLATIRRVVGPDVADRVTADNSDALKGTQMFDNGTVSPISGRKEIPGYRRAENTFVAQVQSGAATDDQWFDMFALVHFPSSLLARLAQKVLPQMNKPSVKVTTLRDGRDLVVHRQESTDFVRRWNKLV